MVNIDRDSYKTVRQLKLIVKIQGFKLKLVARQEQSLILIQPPQQCHYLPEDSLQSFYKYQSSIFLVFLQVLCQSRQSMTFS